MAKITGRDKVKNKIGVFIMNKRILLTLLLPALTFFLIGIQSINSPALAQTASGPGDSNPGVECGRGTADPNFACPGCEDCKASTYYENGVQIYYCFLSSGASCSGRVKCTDPTKKCDLSPTDSPACKCIPKCKTISERVHKTTNKKGTTITRKLLCASEDDVDPAAPPQ